MYGRNVWTDRINKIKGFAFQDFDFEGQIFYVGNTNTEMITGEELTSSLILFAFGIICIIVIRSCMKLKGYNTSDANSGNGSSCNCGNGSSCGCNRRPCAGGSNGKSGCSMCDVLDKVHDSDMYHKDLEYCMQKEYQLPKKQKKVRFVEPKTDFTQILPFESEDMYGSSTPSGCGKGNGSSVHGNDLKYALSHQNPVSDTNLEGMTDVAKYFKVDMTEPDGHFQTYRSTATRDCRNNVYSNRIAHPDRNERGLGFGGLSM